MIEVELTPEEQPHPAMDNPTNWFGKRGSFWSFDIIEHITDEQAQTMNDAIREWLRLADKNYGAPLSTMVKDIEICGSYAFGNFKWWSDMDIQLTTEDPETQDQLGSVFLSDLAWFKESTADLSHRLKIHLDINFWVSDNKSYNEVYSLRDRMMYNKPSPEPMPDSYHRRFNQATRRYEVQIRTRPPCYMSVYWDADGNLLDWKNNG